MTYSCLVRLVPEALAEGRFVGQVEDVDSGVLTTVATLEEFVALVRRNATGAPA